MKYVIAIIICAILFASNPKLEAHQRAAKDKISQVLRSQLSKSIDNSVQTEFAVMLGASLVDDVIIEVVKRKDYFFFSLTSIEFNGNNSNVGIGILGQVWFFDEINDQIEQLKEKLR